MSSQSRSPLPPPSPPAPSRSSQKFPFSQIPSSLLVMLHICRFVKSCPAVISQPPGSPFPPLLHRHHFHFCLWFPPSPLTLLFVSTVPVLVSSQSATFTRSVENSFYDHKRLVSFPLQSISLRNFTDIPRSEMKECVCYKTLIHF